MKAIAAGLFVASALTVLLTPPGTAMGMVCGCKNSKNRIGHISTTPPALTCRSTQTLVCWTEQPLASSHSVSSDTLVTIGDTYLVDHSLGNVTLTLPLSSSVAVGSTVYAADPVNTTINGFAFTTQGSDTIFAEWLSASASTTNFLQGVFLTLTNLGNGYWGVSFVH